MRPHLPGEAGARGALTSALQRCAARRRARRASVGEVLGAAVLAEGRRRAGGGVGETQAESLVGDAVKAVVDESGEPQVWARQAVAWRTAAAC